MSCTRCLYLFDEGEKLHTLLARVPGVLRHYAYMVAELGADIDGECEDAHRLADEIEARIGKVKGFTLDGEKDGEND